MQKDPCTVKKREWRLAERARLGDDLCESIDAFWPFADREFDTRLCAFLETTRGDVDETSKWELFCRSLWEMHVGLACLHRGLALVPTARRDLKRGGPDHLVMHGSQRTWIECVRPEDGQNKDGNDDRVGKPDLNAVGMASLRPDALLLRYTSAFKDKAEKFEEYRSKGIIRDDDRLVIAISGSQIMGARGGFAPHPEIVRSLFPIGPMELRWIPGEPGSERVVLPHRLAIPKGGMKKDCFCCGGCLPREPVPQTAFLNPLYASIHGVLFSSCDVFCGHDSEAMEFTYIVNPLAQLIAPSRWFVQCEAYEVVDGYLVRSDW